MVGEEGLEPSQDCSYKILSLARLPIPPLAHVVGNKTSQTAKVLDRLSEVYCTILEARKKIQVHLDILIQ